jgi:hypothetical protein
LGPRKVKKGHPLVPFVVAFYWLTSLH